jgi:predicted nucleic acid-binding protein
MIILDTNVVSEAIKIGRDKAVVNWLDRQATETLYITVISLSEFTLGIELLPKGQRKNKISSAVEELIEKYFASRILPFDRAAAIVYGSLVATARKGGKQISIPDGQIAAIASVHGFTVATQDTSPFASLGIPYINPWVA